jgi:hypothetical protein
MLNNSTQTVKEDVVNNLEKLAKGAPGKNQL